MQCGGHGRGLSYPKKTMVVRQRCLNIRVRRLSCPPSDPKLDSLNTPTAPKNTKRINLISVKAFEQELKKGAPFIILTAREVESNNSISPEITPVIKEFSDIFSDKLPPMCDIQHDMI